VENNPLSYVWANWFLITRQRGIANLFAANPYPIEFNGSLWILKYQALCYLSLILIGLKSTPKYRKQVFLALFLFFWWANVFEGNIRDITSAIVPQFRALGVPNVFVYFLSGGVFFLYVENIPLKRNLFVCLVVAGVLGLRMGLHNVVGPLALPYILLYLGKKLPFREINKWGDYSYGIYIYAFPIQQTLVFFGLSKYGIVWYFTLSLLITLPLAIMSWWLVEKPCLGLKAVGVHSLMSVPLTLQKTHVEK
jgi:peptidoglycan/LPS O-acetylase OafA/YrhL